MSAIKDTQTPGTSGPFHENLNTKDTHVSVRFYSTIYSDRKALSEASIKS